MTLDTNERFFNWSIDTTLIEPYPDTLWSLLKTEDKPNLVQMRLQDVPLDRFEHLEENDILFVDSTHVSKINSDVNKILFEILPVLKPGVHVHFHDIVWPFEYPKEWVYEGRAWNEAYILRAFLMFNKMYKIVLMSSYVCHFFGYYFKQYMPLCLENSGTSLWIKKMNE
ncbi:MAG: hypothetical protein U5L07_16635 [Desulfobacterales bacterium]|nr:hypothetical protein [Desulfobacterales bacterium]